MKTPKITMLALGLMLALGIALPVAAQDADEASETQAQAAQEETSACARWSFKNLSLGMTIAQVKERYEAATPDKRKRDAEEIGGYAYRWWHKDGAQRIDFNVLANAESDEGQVLQISAQIKGGGISPSQWHTALLQKWGGITELREDEPSPGMSTMEGRSIDDACDVHVEFSGTGNTEEMTLEITLVSIAATRQWDLQQAQDANRNEARDLLD